VRRAPRSGRLVRGQGARPRAPEAQASRLWRRGSTAVSHNQEVAMSESPQDRPDEVDENAPKPGEPDTETVAGQPRKAPESKDGEEQTKQDQ
jgi:hypothetical protein